jgi:hypothetical protein
MQRGVRSQVSSLEHLVAMKTAGSAVNTAGTAGVAAREDPSGQRERCCSDDSSTVVQVSSYSSPPEERPSLSLHHGPRRRHVSAGK